MSPSKFESQATASPSKLSVPNRKQRNQPSNRVHDIEFATEISTSLLTQVRHLQALLAEKEESLRSVTLEKARLEAEAEVFNQRLRALDESEHRYKDENWNLETQIHEHIASAKESADREKKLTQALNILQAEKTTAQKELDEIKLSHSKLSETHAAAVKYHDMELGGLKRNMTMAENERGALQRKIEDLTGQNQELAMAIARQRAMADEQESQTFTDEDFETADDNITPEHSPPPSPVKNTPRHSHLETETLKSSLHHAHRMIQSLKGNIHREKTEKLELKRMLQDARDELEARRDVAGGSIKRNRKVDSKEFKKPFKAGQLGGLRNSRSEVSIEDAQWEDQYGESSPTRAAAARVASMPGGYAESSDQFETSNETSDAFETANERGTETDDFHTGNERFTDSDELTETESGANVGTVRARRPAPLALTTPGNRNSFQSTASLSGDEYSYEDVKTPVQNQPQRLRLRMGRESTRRSRIGSEEHLFDSSPATASNSGTPQQPGQSLFAELGELNSDEDDSYIESSSLLEGTPNGKNSVTPAGTPAAASVPLPPTEVPMTPTQELSKPAMVDSGMMTDTWEPAPATPQTAVPIIAAGFAGAGIVEAAHELHDRPDSIISSKRPMSDASSQWYYEQSDRLVPASPWLGENRPLSMISDVSTHPGDIDERLAKFPVPPTLTAHTPNVSVAAIEPVIVPLSISPIQVEQVEPIIPETEPVPEPVRMAFSSIKSTATEPLSPVQRPVTPIKLAFVAIESTATEPVSPVERPVTPLKLAFVPIESTATEPLSPVQRPTTPLKLAFAPIESTATEPISPVQRPVTPVNMAFSSIESTTTEPLSFVERPITPLKLAFVPIISTATKPVIPVERPATPVNMAFSSIGYTATEPINPVEKVATPITMAFSSIGSAATEPISPVENVATPVKMTFSSIGSTTTEPLSPVKRPETPIKLAFSSVESTATVPVSPVIRPITPPRPVTPVAMAFSLISSIAMEPIEPPIPIHDSRREAVIIPRDESASAEIKKEEPATPKGFLGGISKRTKDKTPIGPFIAEDETRQSPNQSPTAGTPESQRPLKELSVNTNERPIKKPKLETTDSIAQTSLTAEEIDAMFKKKAEQQNAILAEDSHIASPPRAAMIPLALRVRKSQESISSVVRHPRRPDPDFEHDTVSVKRPDSSSSNRRSSLNSRPPLPPNHQQVIAAAAQRVGSSSSNQPGLMGPPLLPASAYKNPNPQFRPRTPSSQGPASPKNGTTPRAKHQGGSADIFTTNPVRSRASSVTSFASEVNTRFNLSNGPADLSGLGSGTDPRMIQAITQTMIGEYLWKYTRKPGRSEMSDTRHRRYFWVHPYTRTLYWSDRDPSTAGRAELKAKSVAIEAVRVVTDDNPMPPGLHRKSLVVLTPGRAVKFTAQTGQRHETWFNALSYLLLRTDDMADEDVAGALTRQDVDEFNPGYRSTQRAGAGAASLSSYNSRTTHNESPARGMMDRPTLVGTAASRTSMVSRLSSYLRPDVYGSRRSRLSGGKENAKDSIYEASEVHDSAEDLREMIEKQDRESDRLENVRACCDGEFPFIFVPGVRSGGKLVERDVLMRWDRQT